MIKYHKLIASNNMNKSSRSQAGSHPNSEKTELINEVFSTWRDLTDQMMTFHSKSLKAGGLKFPSFIIIRYLYFKGPQNLTNLAEMMEVSKPTVTSMVDNLEKHGLVSRFSDKKDRRKFVITLSTLGYERINKINITKDEIKHEMAKVLNDEQLQFFRDFMLMLKKVMGGVLDGKLDELTEGEELVRT